MVCGGAPAADRWASGFIDVSGSGPVDLLMYQAHTMLLQVQLRSMCDFCYGLLFASVLHAASWAVIKSRKVTALPTASGARHDR